MQRVALLSLHSSPIAPLGSVDVGGMNLYVRHLADELQARGLQADIFTRQTEKLTPEIVPLPSGARVIHLPAGPRRRVPKRVLPLYVPALVGALHTFMERETLTYDVLHSHYWLSGQVAWRLRVRQPDEPSFVHMFHTLIKLKDHHSSTPDHQDSTLRYDAERCLVARADAIVGATAGEERDLVKHYGRTPQRFDVIPPGVDLDLFYPRPQREARQRLGIRSRHVILFVGRLDRLKGLETLLRAVALLTPDTRANLKVILVGGHDGAVAGSAARYGRLACRLGLDGIVEFRGKVDQRQLPLYYAAADICAVPSVYESFGMVATEAMACQTPPVAFAVGGLTTTITDGQTGFLVAPGETAQFSRALEHALCEAPLDRIGRRARISVQRYTWARTGDQTVRLYEQLSRSRARRGWPQVAGQ